uniref:Uncharacterized protein ycf23 n=1 Tax=Cyanophora paradoxa TaxID=2762 RepID=YCF23_CYAPA|nr:hypothetical protein CypaCp134 [Cyanophora paradoxa]P31605.1 RecName: Full=Uncharacterized protein ycf23 [Cyanophora paradoxa]AAA65470.1 ORF243 [Cyanophora paradoxa]AAA81302.1 ycf23 [Cyanophora paradoxa]
MNNKIDNFLKQKKLIKVISGLNNFNTTHVIKIAKAASKTNASFIDIAAAPKLVEKVKKEVPNLPICVSAIKPELFVPCVKAGAELIEIGNFDSLYNQGYKINFSDVLSLVKQTRSLLPDTPLSVTIPYLLPLNLQLELAYRLEDLNVDLIQTEGKINKITSLLDNRNIETILPTLASTYLIANNVTIPVICASGLTISTIELPFKLNASGIGIGNAVSKLNSTEEMINLLNEISTRINYSTVL